MLQEMYLTYIHFLFFLNKLLELLDKKHIIFKAFNTNCHLELL